jgi:CBASS immunity sensor of nucleotide second messenger signals
MDQAGDRSFLGSQLSNKVSTDLYQRHRDSESWTWKKSGCPVKYKFQSLQTGSDTNKVALLLCLSGCGPQDNLPAQVDAAYSVYEITLDGMTASPTFLSLREDLESDRSSPARYLLSTSCMGA